MQQPPYRLVSMPIGEVHNMRRIPDTNEEVDPWKLQAQVMLKSGQDVPNHFKFGNSGLTYLALQMEELGEQVAAVKTLTDSARMPTDVHTNVLSATYVQRFSNLRQQLESTAQGLKIVSEMLRAFVGNPNHPPLEFTNYDEAAVLELLDGITDGAVVNAGMAVACGLPGAAAFDHITGSNLSKANPETGLIDIDASGKWIKGPNYRKPDLAPLVQWFDPENQSSDGDRDLAHEKDMRDLRKEQLRADCGDDDLYQSGAFNNGGRDFD